MIEYWITVDQSNGKAVTVGQVLTDDMFNGSTSLARTLLDARPLTPAPEGVDPANPGTGAGTSFHFARRPAANANGWNNSPVTVTFFPGAVNAGGVSQLTLTKTGNALPTSTLTAANPTWTRSDDTPSYPLTLQGSDTATGITSQTATDTLKIDTASPEISFDNSTDSVTVSDMPPDSSKATSGVWRLYRTAADGSSAQLVQQFSLIGGTGSASQSLSGLANGYYVVEDAAGNKSAPTRISTVQPPAVSRPPGSLPGGGTAPVGPALHDPEPVPTPTVTDAPDGTTHAVINETITQVADPSGSLFGGSLDTSDAEALMDYRFAFTTNAAGGLTQVTSLLAADGSALAGGVLSTTAPGACLVRRVATDAQGNTTTVNLTYRLVDSSCPGVLPGGPGTDPADPKGPSGNPGGPADPDDPHDPTPPVTPVGPTVIDPDGTQHTRVMLSITEATTSGMMTEAGAKALLLRHYTPRATDGTMPAVAFDSMTRLSDGAAVSRVDLSKPADYLITYTLADAAGNTTTVELAYHVVNATAPLVVPEPTGDDPTSVSPPPLNPVEPPYVDKDGHHHAVVDDAMTVPVEAGVSISETEARALVEGRYAFLSAADGAEATFVSFSVSNEAGKQVISIDKSLPTSYLLRYKVADADGNTTLLRLRYNLEAEKPDVPNPPLDPDKPTVGPPAITVIDPDDPLPGRPLDAGSVEKDPSGLQHAVIEDTIVVGLREYVMMPADFADLFVKRYGVASALADGIIARGPVSIFDVEGVPLASVDRSRPGFYRIEQVFTDSAGNTTTLRVTYEVRAEFVQTQLPAAGGSAAANVGGGGLDGRGGHYTQLALAQTGDFFGPCPLHPLFMLLIVLASAYGMTKLRLESFARRRLLRQMPEVSAADSSRHVRIVDRFLFVFVSACALVIAGVGQCPYDLWWAASVVAVCAFWLFALCRKVRVTNRRLASAR